jgi:hypothetical protein
VTDPTTTTADGWTGYTDADLTYLAENFRADPWAVHIIGPDEIHTHANTELADDDPTNPVLTEQAAREMVANTNRFAREHAEKNPDPQGYRPVVHAVLLHYGVPVPADAPVPPELTASAHLRRVFDRQEQSDPVLLAAWAKGTLAELDQLSEKHEADRVQLRDAHNDLLDVRGILSPNGQSCRVPAGVEMVPTVAPAIQWLVDEVGKAHDAVNATTRRAQATENHLQSAGALAHALDRLCRYALDRAPDDAWSCAAYYARLLLAAFVGGPDPAREHLSSGESVTSWHTVRLFDGPGLFDPDVVVRQYEDQHPAECHALPAGAACWFAQLEQRSRTGEWPPEWPTEVGTYRVRGTTRIVGGFEEPDYADILEVEPVITTDDINRSVAPELKTAVFGLLDGLGKRLRADGHIPAKAVSPTRPVHFAFSGTTAACGLDARTAPESEFCVAYDPGDDQINCRDCRTYIAKQLRTPDKWCDVYGLIIADPDGWRHPNDPDWTTPIGLREFYARACESTSNGMVTGAFDRIARDIALVPDAQVGRWTPAPTSIRYMGDNLDELKQLLEGHVRVFLGPHPDDTLHTVTVQWSNGHFARIDKGMTVSYQDGNWQLDYGHPGTDWTAQSGIGGE